MEEWANFIGNVGFTVFVTVLFTASIRKINQQNDGFFR